MHNAKVFKEMKKEFGSFKNWLDSIDPNYKDVHKIFKMRFKFMGPEIVNSFLMSVGKVKPYHMGECNHHK